MVKRYVEGLDGKLKLFYLPPYSPHLTRDETVWAHVTRKVSRQLGECRGDERLRTRCIAQHPETPCTREVILQAAGMPLYPGMTLLIEKLLVRQLAKQLSISC